MKRLLNIIQNFVCSPSAKDKNFYYVNADLGRVCDFIRLKLKECLSFISGNRTLSVLFTSNLLHLES